MSRSTSNNINGIWREKKKHTSLGDIEDGTSFMQIFPWNIDDSNITSMTLSSSSSK